MPITALPTPPSRNDPANFAERGDAFLAALPTFVTEANALESNVNQKEASATQAAQTATTKASDASTSANTATTKAGEASTSAQTATTKAGEASASASTAAAKAAEAASSAASIDPATLVRNSGNETIAGVKTFSGGIIVPSLNGGPLSGLRNKHIGGHFDSNPWQRGTSFTVTSSGTYVADRWRIDFDGTANISVAKVALPTAQVINGVFCRYGMKITVNSKSGNTFMRLSQRIEGVDTLTTLAATLQTAALGSGSFSVPVQARQNFGTGGSPSADVVTPFTAALAVTGSMQQLDTGLTVPDMSSKTLGSGGNDFLATEYDLTNVPVGGYIVVALSGIEYGSRSTMWEDRRRQEMSLCQRYYEASGPYSIWSGSTTSGSTAYASQRFKVEKRAPPTVITTSVSALGFPSTAPTVNGVSTSDFICYLVSNGTNSSGYYQFSWTAPSEL